MKKKIMSTACAFALALSMSSVAFADNDYDDMLNQPANFEKEYVIANGGTSPAETFTFSFEKVSAIDAHGNAITANYPDIENVTTTFDALTATDNNTVSVSLNASEYPCTGVYTYEVTENAGNTAGVTYTTTPIYLVVSILSDGTPTGQQYVAAVHYETEDGAKTGQVTNTYESGSLSVTKEIEGNMADMDKTFAFTVVFTAPANEVVRSEIGYTVAGTPQAAISFPEGQNTYTATFNLGDGQTTTFTNIPEGVTYTISENAEGYEWSVNERNTADGQIAAGDADAVTYTNALGAEIDTAAMLDSMPFVVMLVAAGAGLAFFAVRRRQED